MPDAPGLSQLAEHDTPAQVEASTKEITAEFRHRVAAPTASASGNGMLSAEPEEESLFFGRQWAR
jgi:hypothetical protein